MIVYYSDNYVNRLSTFDTMSKAKMVYEIARNKLPSVQFRPPMPLTMTMLESNHSKQYVNAVMTGHPANYAESSGLGWTTDTWNSTIYSNGGMLAAAMSAIYYGVSGTLSSGMHHARTNCGAGFCTFNGLAITANELSSRGYGNILIIDVDAHCGGGTVQMTEHNPNIYQFDLSTSDLDFYRPDRRRQVFMSNGYDYLGQLNNMLDTICRLDKSFDICLYNAGVDPHTDCFVGGADNITAEVLSERDSMIFKWCKSMKIPVAFALAGGYTGTKMDKRSVAKLHVSTIREALSIY